MRGQKNNLKSGNRRFSLFYGKIIFHPLFLIFGLWNALTGNLLTFFSIVVCAILHELAHAAEAAKHGVASNEIILMPYGATIEIDLEGVSVKDEIRISLAGPLCNLLIAVFFLALWWCFPSAYPYTETAFYATLSLALCNLIPAYPLDGGRILYCLLVSIFNAYLPPQTSKKQAKRTCFYVALIFCILGFLVFLFGLKNGRANPSLLLFVLFVAIGLFEKRKTSYQKIDFSNRRAFERGVPVKRIAVSETCTIKKALSFLSSGDYIIFDVYRTDETHLGSLTQSQLSDLFQKTDLYTPLCEYFS